MVTHKVWKKNLLIKYLCPRDFRRGEMEENMSKQQANLVCLLVAAIWGGASPDT